MQHWLGGSMQSSVECDRRDLPKDTIADRDSRSTAAIASKNLSGETAHAQRGDWVSRARIV